MGTWGAAIFSDDLAEDVRDDWRDALLAGLDPDEATAKLLREYSESRSEAAEAPVFWFSLAAAQMETGRLQSDVRDNALALIDTGGDISRFEEVSPAFGRQREKVLARFAEKLRGPQRPATRLRATRAPRSRSPLAAGDVILLEGATQRSRVLFVVVGHYTQGEGDPVVASLLWEEPVPPSADEMLALPLVLYARPVGSTRLNRKRRLPALHTVDSPPRGPLALQNYGQIIARGLRHPSAPAVMPYRGLGTWSYLAAWIEDAWYARCLELTKDVYGL